MLRVIAKWCGRAKSSPDTDIGTIKRYDPVNPVYVTELETEDGRTKVEHIDGVPWTEAEVPHRKHKCWPQTRGWTNWLTCVYRCPCGAIKLNSFDWAERNSRQRK